MLKINKILKLKSITLPNYTRNSINDINISLSKPYVSSISSTINKINTDSSFKIKIDDIIQVNISLENENNFPIDSLKLNFLHDINFLFIPGSLINSDTKECYSSENITNNSFILYNLLPSKPLNISFFIKATFQNINYSNSSISNLLLMPISSSKSFKLTDLSKKISISLDQAIIKIDSDHDNGLITIENFGNASANNLLFKYSAPLNFKADISNFEAFLNNEPYNISTHKINNDIIFNIANIPPCSNGSPSRIAIFFNSINLNSLNSCKVTIK